MGEQKNWNSYLSHLAADDDYYRNYHRNTTPTDQLLPSKSQLRWLEQLASDDVNYQSLSEADRAQYWACVTFIERSISFLNQDGTTLKPEKRLFISFAIARVLFKQDPTVIESIGSVVIYDGALKICKSGNEAGFVTVEGPMKALRGLMVFHTFLSNTLHTLHQLPASTPETLRLRRAVATWNEELKRVMGDLKKSKSFNVKKLDALLVDMRKGISLFSLITEASGGVETLIDALLEVIQPLRNQSVSSSNIHRTSIHLSWLSVLATCTSPAHDLITHEVAHLLHSHLDTRHYLTGDLEGKSNDTQFATTLDQIFDRHLTGEFSFLSDYARTNAVEFFAVCSEYFFTKAPDLLEQAPEIFDLLAESYGYKPKPRAQKSQWWLIRTFFGRL